MYPAPKPPTRKKVRGGKRGAPTGRPRIKSRGPRTKKSGGHLFAKGVSEERRAFIRGLPCVLAGRLHPDWEPSMGWLLHQCVGPVRACHLKSRGSGGQDAGNLWPGCDGAHDEQYRRGIRTFEERWAVTLAWECARREAEYLSGVERGGAHD